MKWITPHYLRIVHQKILTATGGTPGIRDEALLESACAQPFASFGGEEAHPTIIEKAAALGAAIIQNHPFIDGNKRVGVIAALAILAANGVMIECRQAELVRVGFALATGKMDRDAFADWLQQHRT